MYTTSALQPLAEIRRSLDELISSETILIGHALENDLKTLRMIHFRNVDTAVVFRHPAGPPYRRALRDLYDVFSMNGETYHLIHPVVGSKSTSEELFKRVEPTSATLP
jgi:hypothetical protein